MVFKGYDAGAVDYIYKQVATEILRGKVKVFLELCRQRQALQETAARRHVARGQGQRTSPTSVVSKPGRNGDREEDC